FPDASLHITTSCLTYLSFDPAGPGNRPAKGAFFKYAAEYWAAHARGEPESRIRPTILWFL
ncbi:hypothetical protein B0H14DRAFT_2307655, partial [Mycena olivaceomarginata]